MANKDPVLKAAEDWLNANSGKTLQDYYKETNYDGPKLKTKQRAGQPAQVGYRTAASTTGPAAKRKEALEAQIPEYINAWLEAGFSLEEAEEALSESLGKTKKLQKQVTQINREKGRNTVTLGHETAAMEGGGDFGRNTRLERGTGPGGNFSRGAGDETPDWLKPALGIPRSGRGGRDSAIMDMDPDLFDLGLTPQDKQRIKANPELANAIIRQRQIVIEALQRSGKSKPVKPAKPAKPTKTSKPKGKSTVLTMFGNAVSQGPFSDRFDPSPGFGSNLGGAREIDHLDFPIMLP